MNERIFELALKAMDFQGAMDTDTELKLSNEELKKFAELIVKECAKRCEDIAIKHQVEETTYAAGKKAGAFECAADLKQHFGVEE